ncbi:GNAT family N-acetyltransferase [Oceanospirillum sediminis]|uniref:GNAT family N-acetyltransferase n=1 Tax=Oceanospirillum sediminis TaxID=2760088 RepID=A0A839IN23_9GAMM|nr:GNAT family N-acetyltransferase [Oceanospirillum sediminis]MBB1486853.1 GNAT family N-acetyltransferase [Oceanospirillum sediminis]
MNAISSDTAIDIMNFETERLRVRPFSLDDAEFVLKHFNEPDFISGIADKGLRTLDDALDYLRQGPMQMYLNKGFSLGLLGCRQTGACLGTCGLIQRDYLPEPDVGYSLTREHWGKGYIHEAVQMLLQRSHAAGWKTLAAIVNPDNRKSRAVLERLGFAEEGEIHIPPDNIRVLHMRWKNYA